MNIQEKLDFILEQVKKIALKPDIDYEIFAELMVFRGEEGSKKEEIKCAGMGLCLQGKEKITLNDESFSHNEGFLSACFVPMPLLIEIEDASAEKPFYGIGMFLNHNRLARVLLKLSQAEKIEKPKLEKFSAIVTGPADEPVIDAFYRLAKIIHSPTELAVLGESLMDEVYFRVLYNQEHEIYKHLLQNQSNFQQISQSVDYIHEHLNTIISVEELADVVNMSISGFHKKFKDVMRMSPLQYVKSIKLDKAQTYLMQGRNVSQAADLVGYNSLAQFSREYKRHFGVLPSKI